MKHTESSLDKHVKITHGKVKSLLKCTYCGQNYTTRLNLRNHINLVHGRVKGMTGYSTEETEKSRNRTIGGKEITPTHVECGKHFFTKSSLYRHVKEVHCKVKPLFKCAESRLYKHVKKAQANVTPLLKCTECGHNYPTRLKLRNHINLVHRKVKEPLEKCTQCNKTYCDDIKRHIQVVPQRQADEFYCLICITAFSKKLDLDLHLQTVHCQEGSGGSENTSPWVNGDTIEKSANLHSDVMGEHERASVALKDSEENNGMQAEAPFHEPINIYQKEAQKHNNTMTDTTHDKERLFKCTLCMNQFSTSSTSLIQHIKTIHKTSEIFFCLRCSTLITDLMSHRCGVQKQGEAINSDSQPQYSNATKMCADIENGKESQIESQFSPVKDSNIEIEQTIKGLAGNSPLKRNSNHLQLKTNIKQRYDSIFKDICDEGFLKCTECKKHFSTKWNLARHFKSVHQRVKPFCCFTCKKSFSHRYHFNVHLRKGHKQNDALSRQLLTHDHERYTDLISQKKYDDQIKQEMKLGFSFQHGTVKSEIIPSISFHLQPNKELEFQQKVKNEVKVEYMSKQDSSSLQDADLSQTHNRNNKIHNKKKRIRYSEGRKLKTSSYFSEHINTVRHKLRSSLNQTCQKLSHPRSSLISHLHKVKKERKLTKTDPKLACNKKAEAQSIFQQNDKNQIGNGNPNHKHIQNKNSFQSNYLEFINLPFAERIQKMNPFGFYCPDCDRALSTRGSLSRHINANHNKQNIEGHQNINNENRGKPLHNGNNDFEASFKQKNCEIPRNSEKNASKGRNGDIETDAFLNSDGNKKVHAPLCEEELDRLEHSSVSNELGTTCLQVSKDSKKMKNGKDDHIIKQDDSNISKQHYIIKHIIKNIIRQEDSNIVKQCNNKIIKQHDNNIIQQDADSFIKDDNNIIPQDNNIRFKQDNNNIIKQGDIIEIPGELNSEHNNKETVPLPVEMKSAFQQTEGIECERGHPVSA